MRARASRFYQFVGVRCPWWKNHPHSRYLFFPTLTLFTSIYGDMYIMWLIIEIHVLEMRIEAILVWMILAVMSSYNYIYYLRACHGPIQRPAPSRPDSTSPAPPRSGFESCSAPEFFCRLSCYCLNSVRNWSFTLKVLSAALCDLFSWIQPAEAITWIP